MEQTLPRRNVHHVIIAQPEGCARLTAYSIKTDSASWITFEQHGKSGMRSTPFGVWGSQSLLDAHRMLPTRGATWEAKLAHYVRELAEAENELKRHLVGSFIPASLEA